MLTRLVTVLGLLTLLCAAAALGAGPTPASNRRAAERDTRQLLGRVVLPASAKKLAAAPGGAGGLLGGPFQIPSGKLVARHRFWRVDEPLDAVVAFVKANRPRGSVREGAGGGSVGGPGYPDNETLTFPFAARPGRLSLRWLNVTLVALRDGGTGVRADAQDIWIVPRPPGEVLPPGVREVEVASHRVADRAKVRRIIHWFDALPIVQPGSTFHCPALVVGPTIRLVFRGSGGVLARASFEADTTNHSLVSAPCTPILFSIGGHAKAPLVGGRFFLRVQRLLGVKLL